jgi:hypothetical protein
MKSRIAKHDGGSAPNPHALLKRICIIFGGLGATHFVIGIALTLRLAYAASVANDLVPVGYWISFLPPYFVILLLFVGALFCCVRSSLVMSLTLLCAALSLAIILCVYDFANDRCQSSGGGSGPLFTMWWWYYEPFFHGYKPGNV